MPTSTNKPNRRKGRSGRKKGEAAYTSKQAANLHLLCQKIGLHREAFHEKFKSAFQAAQQRNPIEIGRFGQLLQLKGERGRPGPGVKAAIAKVFHGETPVFDEMLEKGQMDVIIRNHKILETLEREQLQALSSRAAEAQYEIDEILSDIRKKADELLLTKNRMSEAEHLEKLQEFGELLTSHGAIIKGVDKVDRKAKMRQIFAETRLNVKELYRDDINSESAAADALSPKH